MIIQGIAHWAKIVGDPQPGYDKTEKEWSIDVEIDEAAQAVIKEAGLGSKIKEAKDGYKYISFKRKALKRGEDGGKVPAKPIRIVDSGKRDWDGKTLIGNGSTVNVSFVVNDVPYNGKSFKKPGIIAVQVVKLVEYEGGQREDFPEYNEDGSDNWAGE